mgnify:CR=1 FL=1
MKSHPRKNLFKLWYLVVAFFWFVNTGFRVAVDTIRSYSNQPKIALRLTKVDPQYVICMPCTDFIWFYQNENRRNFREYALYLQSGYYHLDLLGTKGTSITLFGAEEFKLNEGFLILQKEDDKIVTIDDLEKFSPGRWHNVKAQKNLSGGFSAFYQPGLNFKERVSSFRWGMWWEKLPLADLKAP